MRHRAIFAVLIATGFVAAVAAPVAAQQAPAPAPTASPTASPTAAPTAAPGGVRTRRAAHRRRRPPSEELLFIWAQTLAAPDSDAAAKAGESLVGAGARALRHVKPLLQSSDSTVRQRAADVIARIGTPATRADSSGAAAQTKKTAAAETKKTAAAETKKTAAAATTAQREDVWSGARIVVPTSNAAKASTGATASRSSPATSASAATVAEIVAQLATYPPNVQGEPVRRRLLIALRDAGPAAAPAVPALLAALRHNDTLTTSALGEAAENWRLTFDVFAAIGPGARSAIPVMLAALDQNAAWSPSDRDAAFRDATAAKALAAMGPDGVAALVSALHDVNGVRRRNAAYGLSYVRTAQAVAALAGVVRDTAHVATLAAGRARVSSEARWDQAWQLEAARIAAIDALGAIGPTARDALPVLQSVAASPSPTLGAASAASAASQAIDRIRGVKMAASGGRE
ncbi:MAG TPA: hypothetical protein VF041_13605 [Gemmatimonadaceae bacterium]